ncbi:hypothetical protein [Xanthomonas translucens]|uniref:hypothetical protein n=1 Tax=Xanthomonas campestris pv. translucens TaxID=343 RepID=UPI000B219CD5|nr:hypothetical protein [Xanthomonas translucens]
MKKILGVKYASPLEREYEAWIVAGIESYLKSIGLRYAIWAVGSTQEKIWPADEKLSVGAKIVGLQFKRAKLAKGVLAKDRLSWSFGQPAGQFNLVKATPEIYYCLPTFINRDLRSEALHHCLFWRPDPGGVDKMNAWYDNPRKEVENPYKKIDESMRWGLFFERLMYCSVGKKVNGAGDVEGVVRKIATFYTMSELARPIDGDVEGQDGAYILVIELTS